MEIDIFDETKNKNFIKLIFLVNRPFRGISLCICFYILYLADYKSITFLRIGYQKCGKTRTRKADGLNGLCDIMICM